LFSKFLCLFFEMCFTQLKSFSSKKTMRAFSLFRHSAFQKLALEF
jgi:hypothetical protein